MAHSKELSLLKMLAEKYAMISANGIQNPRRKLWKLKNSRKPARPPIYLRHFAWKEMPEAGIECQNSFHRQIEEELKNKLFWYSLDDDSVFEPWFTVRAVYNQTGWGLLPKKRQTDPQGAWKEEYPIENISDLSQLVFPAHSINEEETAKRLEIADEFFCGILTVNLDRGPAWRSHGAALSSDLGHLRGIENFMLDEDRHA
jgi:hypothetical protein